MNVIPNTHYVILSAAKDLKVYVTVDALTLREILHFVQNDTSLRYA